MNRITMALMAITITIISGTAKAQNQTDTLLASDISIVAGDTAVISIYLRNTHFDVAGFTFRLELAETTYVEVVETQRGLDVADFEYFGGRFGRGFVKLTGIVNMPGGADPAPLPRGRHEIARIKVYAHPGAPDMLRDSLFFRNDTLPPPIDNSISDNSGYINVIPVLTGSVVTVQGATGIDDDEAMIPDEIDMGQNYPNPFNAETMISFALHNAQENARLVILDMLGRPVHQINWKNLSAGEHSVRWDGRDGDGRQLASGVYFYRLETSKLASAVRRMTLMK